MKSQNHNRLGIKLLKLVNIFNYLLTTQKSHLVSHLRNPEPTQIPAILSRATPLLTMLGSWTTPNSTTVSNSPDKKGQKQINEYTKEMSNML